MSLGNEVRDFLAAYTQVRQTGLQQKRFELDERRTEADMEYRNQQLDLQRQQLDMQRQRLTSGGSARPPSPSELRAQARFEWEAADRERAETERRLNSALPATNADTFDFEGEYAGGGLVRDPTDETIPAAARQAPARPAIPDMRLGAPQQSSSPASPPSAAAPAPAPAPAAMTAAPRMALPAVPGEGGPSSAPQTATPQTATPQPEAPAQRPTPETVTTAAEAVDSAIRTAAAPAAIGEGSPGQQGVDFATNQGALSMQEYGEIVSRIDPEGTLAPHLQSMAVLVEGYDFFREEGQPERAAQFAAQIIATQRQMSQTLGALASNALENGDMESACKLLSDACNRFPSDHEVSIVPNEAGLATYRVTRGEEVVEEGRLNTQQLWELTGSVTNGTAFLQQAQQFGMEFQQRPTPQRAQNAAIDARIEFDEISAALDQAVADGVTGDELRELQQAAQEASQAVRATRQAAIDIGVGRTDLDAAISNALDTRVDPALADPALAEGPARREGGGALGSVLGAIATGGRQQVDVQPEMPALPEGRTAVPTAPAAPTTAPSAPAQTPPAPRNIADRVDGMTYLGPNNRMVIWRADAGGWEPVR